MERPTEGEADAPIRYFDRHARCVRTEKVYGERFLKWAYGNPAGRLTVWLVVRRLLFSRIYGWLMRRPASRAKVEPFIRDYGLDPSEFARPPEAFESFDAFFHRRLKNGVRPIGGGDGTAVFPADGRHLVIEQPGRAGDFFVKGERFDLRAFLGDGRLAGEYAAGTLLLSRLCPVDYHRFHFPAGGNAAPPVPIRGGLRSVSPLALRRDPSILWTNKRERTALATRRFGTVQIVEIGATCVGAIHQTYTPGPVAKGAEKGYFAFGGSCVATLFPPGALRVDADLLEQSAKGREVYARMGERCGSAAPLRTE